MIAKSNPGKSRVDLGLLLLWITYFLSTVFLSTVFVSTVFVSTVFVSTVQAEEVDRSLAATDIRGEAVQLRPSDEPQWTVVVFVGVECPLARLYAPRIAQLAERFKDQPVRWVGIDSNQQDNEQDLRRYANEYDIKIPLIHDRGNRLADRFGATRTPEVFVLDQELAVRYRGRIDDQYSPGRAKTAATRHDLREALEQLVAGKLVEESETDPVGCLIGRVRTAQPDAKVTFTRDIAPILNQHCVECHRAGEIAPFSLTEYDEVVGWADAMMESIDERRMPPWHAAPAEIRFHNARHIPDSAKELLRQWIDAGTPQGDPADSPDTPEFRSGWRLPSEPDAIIAMRNRPFRIPASGTVEYQYFVVDPKFKEDRWVTAAQVLPGNRTVVHHAIVFIRPPDGSEFRGVGWLGGFVPGQRSVLLQPGLARRVPAGSKLVFQMHYTPTGSPQNDLTKIGLVFAEDADVSHEVFTVMGIDQEFEIPPGVANYPVKFSATNFPQDGTLLAIIPHMHLRGRSFRLSMNREGQTRTLLDVPQYDFNWQHSYELAQPLSLSGIDRLNCVAVFDNSAGNVANPDPSQRVTWGDQTWEEMAVAFFAVSQPRSRASVDRTKRTATPRPTGRAQDSAGDSESAGDSDSSSKERAKQFTDRFFRRHDKNGDGVIASHEMPRSVQAFSFRDWDQDGDGMLRRREVEQRARRKFSE